MTLELRITSDEITPWLEEVIGKLTSDRWWVKVMRPGMETLQRYATDISPVVTGSYAGSHRLFENGREITLAIDPTARNVKTGTQVQRYAGAVEERHQVYARVGERAEQVAEQVLDNLAEELGFGY